VVGAVELPVQANPPEAARRTVSAEIGDNSSFGQGALETAMNSDSSRRNFLAAGLALPSIFGQANAAAGASGIAYRVLGKTGLKVSSVGFGCMITSDATVISQAVDLGINYFDTARNYQGGNNERMVGAALGAKRKNIILSSKTEADSKSGAIEQLETSLKTLGTDYLDIWYLHAKDKPAQISDDLMEAQQIAKKQGKTRFLGVSTHRLANISGAVLRAGKMEVVLTTYNFTMKDGVMEAEIAKLQQAGIGVVAMKAMAGGMRGGKRREGMPAAALKWALKNPGIATTIPSMTDADQLQQNVQAMAAPFSDADGSLLTARAEEIRPIYCRMCGRCDGECPRGLPVSEVLRCLTYAEGYGQFPLGRQRFLELPGKLAGVRCGECSSCPIECPHGVRVRDRLTRAQELFA
jgi:aryl-alcohol dehydrogenase-like predicted oxidoreductase